MKIAVLGGSFDPVHAGHLQIAKEALKMGMDEVWLMPFGLLLDLWECHKQFTGISKPKRELFIDDIIPAGI